MQLYTFLIIICKYSTNWNYLKKINNDDDFVNNLKKTTIKQNN